MTVEHPVPKKQLEEHQWVSTGKLCGEDKVIDAKKIFDELSKTNPGWKFVEETKDETAGEGEAVVQITYFKVLKVADESSKGLPSSEMPSSEMSTEQTTNISVKDPIRNGPNEEIRKAEDSSHIEENHGKVMKIEKPT